VKVWERREIRAAVAAARCPGCNALKLEVQDINRPSVLCSACGYFNPTFTWRSHG
jgi:Zn ribbon nucleic-acid-binding protein